MKSTKFEEKLKNLVVFIFDLYYLALIISIIISVLLEKFTFYGTNFYKNDYMATSLIRSKINFYITIFIVSIRNLVFKGKYTLRGIMNLEIIDKNNKTPNKWILTIRDFINYRLFPLNVLLILIFNKTIGDYIFKTLVVSKRK
ncbi:unknown [Clostridium sp. CAG:710]|nr:unknown [Clostridium sp. CAG:710]